MADQRLALAERERDDVGDDLAHVLAPQRDLGRRLRGGAVAAVEAAVGRRGPAELVEDRVLQDPVEPRPQVHLAVAGHQGPVGAQERLLDELLGHRAPARPEPPFGVRVSARR
jgi:hypothetical protein